MDNALAVDVGSKNSAQVDEILRRRLAGDGRKKVANRERITATALRRFFEIIDAGMTGASCIFVCSEAFGGIEAPDVKRCVALSLLAAGMAMTARRALKPRGGSLFEPAGRHATIAALATVIATFAASIWWNAAFSELVVIPPGEEVSWTAPARLADWEIAWILLASGCSVVVSLAAAWVARISKVSPLRVAVVGAGQSADPIIRALRTAPCLVSRSVITADDRNSREMGELADLVEAGKIDAVVLAMGEGDSGRINSACSYLADSPVPICLGLDPYVLGDTPALVAGSTNSAFPLHLKADPFSGVPGVAKRCADIVGSALLLIVLSPVLLGTAVAIRLESKGPVLFRQWRFGQCSRPIPVFKFRTMYIDRGDPTGERRTTARDPRVTRVGRILRWCSADELPQLLNVLRGEMSLVGPRPHPMHMKVAGTYYFEAVPNYRARHRVRPGITGWAQINGARGEVATIEQAKRRLELDLYYVTHWSLWLDLVILVRTLGRRVLTSGS